MSLKTIFLDRDGVINQDLKYVYKINDFIFIKGIFESCLYLQNLGYKIIIVTNQSGISRGYFSENDYQKLTKWMLNEFNNNQINILDIFYCPHGPKSNCSCRKPNTGLLIEAQMKYSIDMENSWMIGDKESDISAAINAGVKNTILISNSQSDSNSKYIIDSLEKIQKIIMN